jgi:hypothetical protein
MSTSAINSIAVWLRNGNTLTVRQGRSMFKVANVSDVIYRLRNEGMPVYTNRITNSKGEEVFAYRLGTPSEKFLRNLEKSRYGRARKALYVQALTA